jgi:hypothetical protein
MHGRVEEEEGKETIKKKKIGNRTLQLSRTESDAIQVVMGNH